MNFAVPPMIGLGDGPFALECGVDCRLTVERRFLSHPIRSGHDGPNQVVVAEIRNHCCIGLIAVEHTGIPALIAPWQCFLQGNNERSLSRLAGWV